MALDKLKTIIQSEFPLEDIHSHLQQAASVRLKRFIGSTPAFLLERLRQDHPEMLIVFSNFEDAQFLKSDLEMLGVEDTLLFPPTGQKAYAHQDKQVSDSSILVQRSEVIEQITNRKHPLVITSSDAVFDKIASSEAFSEASIKIETGQNIGFDHLTEKLVDQHYERVQFVDEPGEFAVRGGIIDVFPFSGDYPIRIELFGDEIDSIREFDASSQRSVSFLDSARLVPNVEEISSGNRQSLFDYFSDYTLLTLFDRPLIYSDVQERYQFAESRFESAGEDALPPDQLYLSPEELKSKTENRPQLFTASLDQETEAGFVAELEAKPQPDFNGTIRLLRQNIEDLSKQGMDVYILCDNDGQRDRFEELLGERTEKLRYQLSVETIHKGFILPQAGVAIYTDHQIFNRYHRPRAPKRKYRGGISFKELKDLKIGDFVVHVDYGVGKFAGFKTIEVRGAKQEAVALRYQEDSILYVNVSNLHKVQKYSGKDGTAPKVTKLGSGEWQRKKAKTKKRVKDIARDLINLYARRKAMKAHAYSNDSGMQTELEASFMYEETPDQLETIESVKTDMMKENPMDRLVCGDVGFGKTEVAIRAAFKAITEGKQVAVLVPTTILADQHMNTFKERFQNFAVEVEAISRFRDKSKQKEILQKTAEGKIDVLIGTHRITSKDVKFKDLGLLIVDEEQRFGVAVKEKLKELRATVDTLTLTATPIPRTLQFSLMGARDLSVINTPPPNRQPVQTQIHPFDTSLIRDAITQEISRGGQVFFIHNRVQNIEEISGMIRELVPDVRVQFAHGQMTGSKLEKIIHDFYKHKFDVLVSTNIVENGIDISNANTMIINRADHFGLAELHQLRGRVGRSNRKAYCYLMTPPVDMLTPEARKRLMALEEFSDLGSGFNIAMRDLDIRGAGDILGGEQSGFINEVGFDMYNKILNDAIKELKQEEFKDLFSDVDIEIEKPETQVEFDLNALIPQWYVEDNVERLNLYRRLSEATNEKEIEEWIEEMADRFGNLPDELHNLVLATRIKLIASQLFLQKVIVRSNRMWLQSPKADTEMGEHFFEHGVMQQFMNRLEELKPGEYKLVQKDDAVRFVVPDIEGLKDALEMLRKLQPTKETEEVA